MGLIISRAVASCLPEKTQALAELKRKMGCECMSMFPTRTQGATLHPWALHLLSWKSSAPGPLWVPIPSRAN